MATDARQQRLRIFLVLVSSFLAFIAAAAISVGYSVHRYWQNALRIEITRNLTEKTQMFAARVNSDREHKIEEITAQEGHAAGARATVVDTNGKVISDSEFQISTLEGEARHPEFLSALHGETGIVTRKRNDFGIAVLYVAVPVSGGAVRLAYPLADIDITTAHSRRLLFIGAAIAAVAAFAISWLTAVTVARQQPASV